MLKRLLLVRGSEVAMFALLATMLPGNALWLTTPLSRTRQTAEALFAAGAPGPKACAILAPPWRR